MKESPSLSFRDNLEEVKQLMTMHAVLGGIGPGRKHKVEVLNKSAILFVCAAFEAFIEELATRSFDHITQSAKDHSALPKPILKAIAEILRNDKNEIKVWALAGDGWKAVAESYKTQLIKKYVGPFNTPKPHNVEALLKELTGFPMPSSVWQWKGMSAASAKEKLKTFVELRGSLAHGNKPSNPVLKKDVVSYLSFLAPLSVRFSNEMRTYCTDVTGKAPWTVVSFGNVG